MAAEEGHIFHNRLTHSLKVAQTTRRVAENVLLQAFGRLDLRRAIESLGGLNPDVAEAAALAHDLGHPPFGHIGEEELDLLVRAAGDRNGFEGNAQSFRIVSNLARVPLGRGLNLSRATLAGILKYPWLRDSKDPQPGDKFGAYNADREDFDFAREKLLESGFLSRRQTLEAEIMDWADDIAYAVHDAEDFFRARWIPMDRLKHAIVPILDGAGKPIGYEVGAEAHEFFDAVRGAWPEEEVPADEELASLARVAILEFPLDRPFRGTEKDRVNLRSWTSTLIGRYVSGTSLRDDGLYREPAYVKEVAILKQLTRYFVTRNPTLTTHQVGQRAVLRGLFEIYLLEIRAGKNRVFPAQVLPGPLNEGDATKVRFVCDVIAGMTETQAIHAYKRLTGIDLGPLEDPAIA